MLGFLLVSNIFKYPSDIKKALAKKIPLARRG